MKTNLQLIGNTPLIHLENNLYLKWEGYNLTGSIKDRVVFTILNDLKYKDRLRPGSKIVCPSSGNTAISLAAIAPLFNVEAIVVMPANTSVNKQKIIRKYNAKIVLTPANDKMIGAYNKAQEIVKSDQNMILLDQFLDPLCVKAHLLTGYEILKQMEPDIIVAGIGTGGTITGLAKFFKSINRQVMMIGIEPSEAAIISKKRNNPHSIEGIGAGFIPRLLDLSIIDKIVRVKSKKAWKMMIKIASKYGLLVGPSTAATISVGQRLSHLHPTKKIVVIGADRGDRY